MTSGLGHWGTDTDDVYIIASHTLICSVVNTLGYYETPAGGMGAPGHPEPLPPPRL